MIYQVKKRNNFLSRLENIPITGWIIATNIILWLVILISISLKESSIYYFAVTPDSIMQGKFLWTILTHMFSHIDILHIFANMFSLWFVGRLAERIIGRKRFLWIYLLSGIFAGIITVLLSYYLGYGIGERIFGSALTPMLGASGAIFGIAGLLAVLIPRSKVYLILGPLIAIILQIILGYLIKNQSIMGIITIILNIYIFVAIFSMLSFSSGGRTISFPVALPLWSLPLVAIVPLIIIGLIFPLPIGNIAHLAGFTIGAIYGFYLRRKYQKKVYMLQRLFR